MAVNTLEERKQYINKIRSSFQDPTASRKYQDISDNREDTALTGGFFRLRLLIAVALFAAFVYCDQNQVKIYTYTTKEIYEMVEDTIPVDKIIETIKEIP